MAKKEKSKVEQDLSSFMPILMLTIGSLVFLLVVNTIIIMSNPENVRITSLVRSALYVQGRDAGMEGGAPFPNGNKDKEPRYVDVYRDRVVVYPGEYVVPLRDLETEGNAFEKLLSDVAANRAYEYIVMLVRPRAAKVARRIKKAVHAQDVDVGYELFETDRPVNYEAYKQTE
jgi:hypothetical protein